MNLEDVGVTQGDQVFGWRTGAGAQRAPERLTKCLSGERPRALKGRGATVCPRRSACVRSFTTTNNDFHQPCYHPPVVRAPVPLHHERA